MNESKGTSFSYCKTGCAAMVQVTRYPGLIAILAALIVCADCDDDH